VQTRGAWDVSVRRPSSSETRSRGSHWRSCVSFCLVVIIIAITIGDWF
jgi:hypothetical protein